MTCPQYGTYRQWVKSVLWIFMFSGLTSCKLNDNTIKGNIRTAPGGGVIWAGLDSIEVLSADSLRLHWSAAPGAVGYLIYNVTSNSPVHVATTAGSVLSYDITHLNPNSTYTFRVQVNMENGVDTNTSDKSATTLSVTAVHMGWNHIKSLGGRAPVPQAAGLSASSASVYLKWAAMSLSSGTLAGYNIYRSTSSGGQDFNSPLAEGISAAAREYTDTSVTAGTTYYYVVRPIVGAQSVPTTESDSEIKVISAPENMALVHRWIANQEVCGLMGKTVDRDSNYQCSYTGLGGTGTHYDLGQHLLVDIVETGCNYTPGNVCDEGGLGPCYGLGTPVGNVTAALDTVYYDRNSVRCWINTDGGTTWKAAGDATLTAAQRLALSSNRPGLAPIAWVDQSQGWNYCQDKSVAGFAGTKKLLSRKEFIAASAWDSSMSDSDILAMEYDLTSLVVTGKCNTNSGSGLVFEDVDVPTDPETLPAINTGGHKAVRTGSSATRNCLSRYGIQDMIGNIWEWNTDQINAGVGIVSGIDGTNGDWATWDGSTLTSEFISNLPNPGDYFLVPLGLPLGSNSDGTIVNSSHQSIFGDILYINTTSVRGTLSGGNYSADSDINKAGRFSLLINGLPTDVLNGRGFRCALDGGP